MNWFDQVDVFRGLGGLHILTSSVILGLGGTGGGPSTGGHVQISVSSVPFVMFGV